jgi:hypothetical protein
MPEADTTEYPPLTVDQILQRAEACALTADGHAAEYQLGASAGQADDDQLVRLHREVVHLTALSRAYTELAAARMRRDLEKPPTEEKVDPRAARFGPAR